MPNNLQKSLSKARIAASHLSEPRFPGLNPINL